MSHYTRVRTALRDPAVLTAALKQLGFTHVEVHEQPQTLHGYRGRTEQAEIIIRREHLGSGYGDVGFRRGTDGTYEVVIDYIDQHVHHREWLAKLPQAYGYAAALQYAEAHGYRIETDQVEQDGTRRLVLRR